LRNPDPEFSRSIHGESIRLVEAGIQLDRDKGEEKFLLTVQSFNLLNAEVQPLP
jgi:hypothetical protein